MSLGPLCLEVESAHAGTRLSAKVSAFRVRCFVTDLTMSALRFATRAASLSRAALVVPTRVQPRLAFPPRANFSAAAGLSKEDIQTRVLDVLKGFEKVDPAKVCLNKHVCTRIYI